jgi:hypothetical protein
MKSIFATLVIVGLATCTITSDAVDRGDYLREATKTTETTRAIPYLETKKYRRDKNLDESLSEEEEEQEEENFAKTHLRGSKKTSASLEKLLKGDDAYKLSEFKRDHEAFGKKKQALLSRDLKNERLEKEEAEFRNEKLLNKLRDEKNKEKLREKKDHLVIRKEHLANPLKEENVEILRRNRNPKKYQEGTLEDVTVVPARERLVGERRNELSYNIKIDEDEIDELVEDFEDFSDKYLKKTKKERKALMKKLNQAFRTTAGKMILNFGKIFPPVV